MKIRIIIIAVFSCMLSLQAASQNSVDGILDHFFELYGEEKTDESVDYIFETNQYLLTAQQQIISIKEKLKTITSLIGQ